MSTCNKRIILFVGQSLINCKGFDFIFWVGSRDYWSRFFFVAWIESRWFWSL